MDVSLFDFDLPEGLIALRPARPRDSARLMVVHEDGRIDHAHVRDLPDYLARGDVLVANDTKVIAARLRGTRLARAGGMTAKIEVTLHKRVAPDRFWAFARPARRLIPGDHLRLGETIDATVAARGEAGEVELSFALAGAHLDAAIAREGETPLPPYIAGKRKADAADVADYQTLFAKDPGSVAAPTAGLHFTPDLLVRLETAGVARALVRLHVGAGTFLPVSAADTAAHKMHSEWATLSGETAAQLNAVHGAGGRIVAVGTTSLRTLESAAGADGVLNPFTGETDIFITPGYAFRAVDVLLTNFHLPRSTLFMLVSAFSGLAVMKRAYEEAIRAHYRFYSYGDACLLFRPR
ncbi:MAG: tRNA preQ1(34) S-adenosylmethionine ribosyltransferase-isomerase QueA [Alphaproteobacteria bacterium]|nr:tRNA preQ1(34) S-adenosylmethionine ribosyltransferase-isomerase QueA [Alphaproteobacteria bacterium]MBN9569685.1 tRNA preQ1(34) S-adenosylmethionine ribosyltransferase-isomerase QueA [Alphaproteobacteria bacterium]